MINDPARVTRPMLDVMQALLDAGEHELHGWAITKQTECASPTTYKILERLTNAGWVTARWEEQAPDMNRPRRRLYRLTAEGAVSARRILAERRPGTIGKLRLAIDWMDFR